MEIISNGVLTDEQREARLSQYMAEYKTSLIRMAYLYLEDLALAEDAVQETFLKAYYHMNDFRGESSEKTWLMRIAINTCKSMKRTAWMRVFRHAQPLDAAAERGQADRYRDDSVLQTVMQLPEKDKQVIFLRYYQEMKVEEVAEVLNLSVAATNSRLNRAKNRLRETLKEWYFDGE